MSHTRTVFPKTRKIIIIQYGVQSLYLFLGVYPPPKHIVLLSFLCICFCAGTQCFGRHSRTECSNFCGGYSLCELVWTESF